MNIYLLLFISSLCSFSFQANLWAQNKESQSSSIGIQMGYGFLAPHRTVMKALITGHAKSLEINYNILTIGKKSWHSNYNYPTIGVAFFTVDLGNPQVIGNGYTLFPYVQIPLYKKNHFAFNYRIGSGLGIIEKPFNKVTNYKNVAIGSSLNSTITMNLSVEKKINRFTLGGGIELMHFSNGAMKMPNLGYNIPNIHIATTYTLSDKKPDYIEDTTAQFNSKTFFDLIGAYGVKEIYPIEGNKYPAFSLMGTANKRLNHKSIITVGTDLFYNSSLKPILDTMGYDPSNIGDVMQFGISVGHHLTLGDFSIVFNMGGYLYSKYKLDGIFYHRIGIRKILFDKYILNATLKAHFATADYIEFGIGYQFNHK